MTGSGAPVPAAWRGTFPDSAQRQNRELWIPDFGDDKQPCPACAPIRRNYSAFPRIGSKGLRQLRTGSSREIRKSIPTFH
jgi:hypothetical protein